MSKKPIKQELEELERLVSETTQPPIKDSLNELEAETKLPEEPVTSEKTDEREKTRKKALENLSNPVLRTLTLAYLILPNPEYQPYLKFVALDAALTLAYSKSNGQYCEHIPSVVNDFTYFPNLYTDKGGETAINSILGSKEVIKAEDDIDSGRKCPGSFYGIIKGAAAVIDESIRYLTAQDILDLVGSKRKVAEKYKDMLVSGLPKKVIEIYTAIFIDDELRDAFSKKTTKDIAHKLDRFCETPKTPEK